MNFKLISSSHSDENGKEYKVGDIVSSDRPLDTIFKNKFQRVTDYTPLEQTILMKTPSGQKETDITESTVVIEQDKPLPDGELVDGLFDFDPDETGLHVYRVGKMYNVYEEFDMTIPLNEKPLPKNRVMAFIRAQSEG